MWDFSIIVDRPIFITIMHLKIVVVDKLVDKGYVTVMPQLPEIVMLAKTTEKVEKHRELLLNQIPIQQLWKLSVTYCSYYY